MNTISLYLRFWGKSELFAQTLSPLSECLGAFVAGDCSSPFPDIEPWSLLRERLMGYVLLGIQQLNRSVALLWWRPGWNVLCVCVCFYHLCGFRGGGENDWHAIFINEERPPVTITVIGGWEELFMRRETLVFFFLFGARLRLQLTVLRLLWSRLARIDHKGSVHWSVWVLLRVADPVNPNDLKASVDLALVLVTSAAAKPLESLKTILLNLLLTG